MAIVCVVEMELLGIVGGFVNVVNYYGFRELILVWFVFNGDLLIVMDYWVLLVELEDDSVDGVILGVYVFDVFCFGFLKVNS